MTMGKFTRRGVLAGLAGGAAMPAAARGRGKRGVRFTHNVASGDPTKTAVILWTRAEPEDRTQSVQVDWAIARDPEMSGIVAQGQAETGAAHDFTVKIDAGGLEPGRTYFFRFMAEGAVSPVGRTKTLPTEDAPSAKLAAVSCSNYPAGYFNVYNYLAGRDDLDAVVHLGDYIYEYGPGGYATEFGMANDRAPQPPREIVSLADYRTRYAQYRSDPDLQAAHAAHPFICIWDDHETTNDSWTGGAQNHQPDEGGWDARKRAAVQAYMEWMPIRDPAPGRAREAIWRSFDFGQAVSLIMLESRLTARAEQVDYGAELVYPTRTFDRDGGSETLPALVERTGSGWREITDYETLKRLSERDKLPRNVKRRPDMDAFEALVSDPARELLGADQLSFVAGEFERSKRAGIAWQGLGNQVILAKVRGPYYDRALPWWYKWVMNRQADADNNRAFLERSWWDLPMNMDAWDGYPAERARLYHAARDAGANLAALTGDTHAFWANDLMDDRGALRGVEMGVTSVSSPGMFTGFDAPFVDFSKMVDRAAPDVKHFNWEDRGCVIATFTPDGVRGEFVRVNTIESRDYRAEVYSSWRAAPGGGIGAA